MTGRVRHLDSQDLTNLPENCRSCLFWEDSRAPIGPDVKDPVQALRSKEAWWHAAALEKPTVSRAVYVEDQLVGFALAGDATTLPRSARLGPRPSDDAVLLATLWVHPDHRGNGLAKVLVASILREAARSNYKGLEAYGARRAVASCILSIQVLQAFGFDVQTRHLHYPLFRLDLRQTATWTDSVNAKLEGVINALGRRERAPRPALESRQS